MFLFAFSLLECHNRNVDESTKSGNETPQKRYWNATKHVIGFTQQISVSLITFITESIFRHYRILAQVSLLTWAYILAYFTFSACLLKSQQFKLNEIWNNQSGIIYFSYLCPIHYQTQQRWKQ